MINAGVSHEMRNPLNSIVAQNVQKYELYKELARLMKWFDKKVSQDNLTVVKQQLFVKFNKIMGQLHHGNKAQDSSANMLTFIVQDLLDFA